VAFNSSGLNLSPAPGLMSNCVFGNVSYDYSGITDPTGTNGNLKEDPRLVGLAYGNVHIQPASPCRNAGNGGFVRPGTRDMDGQARIQGGAVDIGADESYDEAGTVTPVVVRVKPDGDDANDGSSWDMAKRTVQAGIDAAAARGGDVWVKAGTYGEQVTVPAFAYVYGGFAGTETARTERNWGLNTTTLDARRRGSVVTVAGGYRYSAVDGFAIRGGLGSGISCNYASPSIANNRITGNAAYYYGGGICCQYGSPEIANNVIDGNGAVYGGGIYCSGFSSRIVGNTIAGNTAAYGGGIYCYSAASATIANTIVAFNSSGILASSGAPALRYNCVFGNADYDYSGVTDPTGSSGNRKEDPQFAGLTYGNVHIQPGSPCRDHGSDADALGTADIDGQPRIQGASVDIGADESNGTTWMSAPVIVRVKPDGDDAQDGSTWPLAKRTVQAGIYAASAQGGDVWVKAGVYLERVTVSTYAYLYGGFAGTETARTERNWALQPTVLDAGSAGNAVKAFGGYRLSTIDGFTIRNGMTNQYPPFDDGGGIFIYGSSPSIANTRITGNQAFDNGGGIFCRGSSPLIENSTLVGNDAPSGGGLHCEYASPTLVNVTIAGNSASNGGGVYQDNSSLRIANSILAFNTSGIYSVSSGPPSLQYNCVFGNTAYDYSGVANPTGTFGNIQVDPRFVDRPGGDYHLLEWSPCRDCGDFSLMQFDDLDLDCKPRILLAGVDMGAYEYAKIANPVIAPPGGTFAGGVSVSLSDSTPGAAIRYTTSGVDPDGGSTLYASPFDVLRSRTVKARAYKTGYDPSDVASAAFTISPTTADVLLTNGYTLIALPLEPTAPMKAADLVQSIAGLGCTRVLRYNGAGYDVYTAGGGGSNFDVRPGEGYFVRCTGAGTWHAPGFRFEAASAPIALVEGYNLVGLPVEPSSTGRYPAATVVAEVAAQGGEATRILRYNGTGYDVYTAGGGGVNFNLRLGEGYFLRCSKASTWMVTK
jgi:hypothetical protein